MINFSQIDTVLLDMDGTLLDLHFDNQFWRHHVPLRYAQKHGLPQAQADQYVMTEYQKVAGQLKWYCLDYWQEKLDLPIVELKKELKHLIKLREDVPEFLLALKRAGKQVILVTNAHPDSLALKLEQTELAKYMDQMLTTHQFGHSKESPELWRQLQLFLDYNPARTLFVDDSINLLYVAQKAGIGHLLGVKNPDSQKPMNEITEFEGVSDFRSLISGIC
ncbi:MAG: GMP/IMP nucleotidase [Algicola sp.]|nr:GMP/IMP nucleotidase [Algicola sp.]